MPSRNVWARTGRAGRILRQKRLALGLTQVFVAEQIGVSRPYFNQIEHGKRGMPADGFLIMLDFYKEWEKEHGRPATES